MKPRYNKPGKKHKMSQKSPIDRRNVLLDKMRQHLLGMKQQFEWKSKTGQYFNPNINLSSLAISLNASIDDIRHCLCKLGDLVTTGDFYGTFRVKYEESNVEQEQEAYKPIMKPDKCPICETLLDVSISQRYKIFSSITERSCKNGCFTQRVSFNQETITIFNGKTYVLGRGEKHHNELSKNEILKEIKQWTKNYRYVARIITGE